MASASRPPPPPPPPRGPQDRRGVWENGSSPCRKYHCWDPRSCPVSHTPPEDRTPQPTDARDSRDIITGQVGPKEKRADVQALRPRQAFRGRNPPEQGRLHRASLQAAEAVVTPHPPPALFRANYYIQRDIIFVVSWH